MQRPWILSACVALLLCPTLALAQTDLAWSYTQNVQRPATSFVVQRCQVVPPATACTNMSDLPAGSALPVTTPSFSDTTAVLNTGYCYVVMAADTAGRSTPSNTLCAGKFVLNSPGTLSGTVR